MNCHQGREISSEWCQGRGVPKSIVYYRGGIIQVHIRGKVTHTNGRGGAPKITFLHLYQLAQDESSRTQNHVGNNLLQSIYKNKSFFYWDQVV